MDRFSGDIPLEETYNWAPWLYKMVVICLSCLSLLIHVHSIPSRLPQGVDLQHISSSLSVDGVLSVEAPAPGTTTGDHINEVVIPVQIRQEKDAEK